jgi:glutaredoxin
LTVWLLHLACAAIGQAGSAEMSTVDLEVFTRPGCPHCEAAAPFLETLQQERPKLRVRVYNVAEDPTALTRLEDLATQHHVQAPGVPAFFVGGTLLIGYRDAETTGHRIKALLDSPLVFPQERDTIDTVLGTLNVRTLGLPVFTFIIGLLDGFNPCAMWVLLFLLSLLVNLQDRKKMFIIGGTFVAVSGLVYFSFMAAWLNIFLLIGLSRTVQLALGGIAVLIGGINVKDFFSFGRGVSLSIPEAVKPAIYARVRRILQAENLTGALVGVVTLAVLVNTIELLCTAGLPAVYTQILTLQQLPWWGYYGYLAFYNVAYMLDDSLILVIAVATLGRRKLQDKEGRWLKLLSGLVMLGLGVVLIARPDWLAG